MLAPGNDGRPQGEEPAGAESAARGGVQVNHGAAEQTVATVVSDIPPLPHANVIEFKSGAAMSSSLLSRWKLMGRAARDARLSRSDLAVLHAIADRIGDTGTAWPSVQRIADDASADKRTVTRSIKRLCDTDYLIRKSGGYTSANVYRLGVGESAPMGEVTPRGEAVSGYGRTGPEGMGEPDHVILPVNPTIECAQEKHPHEPDDSGFALTPSPPTKPEPKPPKKPKSDALQLPDWLPVQAWIDWHDYRLKRTPKGWTTKSQELSITTLTRLRGEGYDPVKVIEQSIENGWTGLFPLKSNNIPRGTNNADHTNRPLSAVERVRAHVVAAEQRDADIAVGHVAAYLVAPHG